jgi:hypothetical protein
MAGPEISAMIAGVLAGTVTGAVTLFIGADLLRDRWRSQQAEQNRKHPDWTLLQMASHFNAVRWTPSFPGSTAGELFIYCDRHLALFAENGWPLLTSLQRDAVAKAAAEAADHAYRMEEFARNRVAQHITNIPEKGE